MVFVGLGILLVSISVLIYKFKPVASATKSVPTFSISSDDTTKDEKNQEPSHENGNLNTPIVATQANSPDVHDAENRSRARKPMSPPPIPNGKSTVQPAAGSLMLPPSRPTIREAATKTPLKPLTSLRTPPSRFANPSPKSLAPSTSTLAPSARPSRKVLLDPGHSPLDWAHLISNPPTPTFLRGADVPPSLIRVPPSLLRYHSGRKGKDAWGVCQGKVYNLTPYMGFHPGGVDQLMRGAGQDKEGEKLFNEIHPWVSWENMLGECLVGILMSEREVSEKEVEKLEEMD